MKGTFGSPSCLVRVRKRLFSAISASICRVPCAAYPLYASAQPVEFLDIAENLSFSPRELQQYPSGDCSPATAGLAVQRTDSEWTLFISRTIISLLTMNRMLERSYSTHHFPHFQRMFQ